MVAPVFVAAVSRFLLEVIDYEPVGRFVFSEKRS